MPSTYRGLYAILDTDFLTVRGVDPLDFLERVAAARPALVQLRAKTLGARDALALLRRIEACCKPLGIPVFMNDRPDLALLAGVRGVHLGQTDLEPCDARALGPELLVGISTHRLDEVDRALLEQPAYVAFGPVFATDTKADTEPVVGLAALEEAARRCRRARVPLVAIGGINLERAALVRQHADAVALISALLPAAGLSAVAAHAAQFQDVLGAAALE
jgi:thiamine-phosphate pyrophosphorylase